jgi:hypothetical protein
MADAFTCVKIFLTQVTEALLRAHSYKAKRPARRNEVKMTSKTVFLSKLIGWYAVLFGLSMLINKALVVNAVTGMLQDTPLVLVLGVVILTAGIAMVLSHNIWSGAAPTVIVSLLGWATLIKGLILLFLSPSGLAAYYASLHYTGFFYVYAIVTLVIGVYLLIAGYRSKVA